MNGIHDMGGMDGFGPVDPQYQRTFAADWEKRVFGVNMMSLMEGVYNIDTTRYYMENVPPAAYLQQDYWVRWLSMIERLLIEKGVLTKAEIDARQEILRAGGGAE